MIQFSVACLVVSTLAACIFPLLHLGDAPWINDEPHFVWLAFQYNHLPGTVLGIHAPFSLASHGLPSSRGAPHGPGNVWLLQLLLAISHNLLVVLAIRASVFMVLIAVALLWLGRACSLPVQFVPVILVSPWLYLYSRHFWDSCNIPVAAMLLASYAGFLKTRSRSAILIATLCAMFLFLVHLTSVAMIIPVAAHLIFFRWNHLVARKWIVIAALGAGVALAYPYFAMMFIGWQNELPPGTSILPSIIYPLLGAHHITATGLGDWLGNWPYVTGSSCTKFLLVAQWISAIGYVAVWIGMALALPRARRVFRRNKNCSVLDHIAAISLAVFACQLILDVQEHLADSPHYYNATWIAYVVFAWLTLDALPRTLPTRVALGVYGMSMAAVTIAIAIFIHQNGGNRTLGYGATIGNQMRVVEQISHFAPQSQVDFQVEQWTRYPVAYETLKLFIARQGSPKVPSHHLVVQYRNAFPGDARIELVDLGPLANPTTRGDNP